MASKGEDKKTQIQRYKALLGSKSESGKEPRAVSKPKSKRRRKENVEKGLGSALSSNAKAGQKISKLSISNPIAISDVAKVSSLKGLGLTSASDVSGPSLKKSTETRSLTSKQSATSFEAKKKECEILHESPEDSIAEQVETIEFSSVFESKAGLDKFEEKKYKGMKKGEKALSGGRDVDEAMSAQKEKKKSLSLRRKRKFKPKDKHQDSESEKPKENVDKITEKKKVKSEVQLEEHFPWRESVSENEETGEDSSPVKSAGINTAKNTSIEEDEREIKERKENVGDKEDGGELIASRGKKFKRWASFGKQKKGAESAGDSTKLSTNLDSKDLEQQITDTLPKEDLKEFEDDITNIKLPSSEGDSVEVVAEHFSNELKENQDASYERGQERESANGTGECKPLDKSDVAGVMKELEKNEKTQESNEQQSKKKKSFLRRISSKGLKPPKREDKTERRRSAEVSKPLLHEMESNVPDQDESLTDESGILIKRKKSGLNLKLPKALKKRKSSEYKVIAGAETEREIEKDRAVKREEENPAAQDISGPLEVGQSLDEYASESCTSFLKVIQAVNEEDNGDQEQREIQFPNEGHKAGASANENTEEDGGLSEAYVFCRSLMNSVINELTEHLQKLERLSEDEFSKSAHEVDESEPTSSDVMPKSFEKQISVSSEPSEIIDKKEPEEDLETEPEAETYDEISPEPTSPEADPNSSEELVSTVLHIPEIPEDSAKEHEGSDDQEYEAKMDEVGQLHVVSVVLKNPTTDGNEPMANEECTKTQASDAGQASYQLVTSVSDLMTTTEHTTKDSEVDIIRKAHETEEAATPENETELIEVEINVPDDKPTADEETGKPTETVKKAGLVRGESEEELKPTEEAPKHAKDEPNQLGDGYDTSGNLERSAELSMKFRSLIDSYIFINQSIEISQEFRRQLEIMAMEGYGRSRCVIM